MYSKKDGKGEAKDKTWVTSNNKGLEGLVVVVGGVEVSASPTL